MSARRGRSNTRWAKIRLQILNRDGWACKIPECSLPGEPITAHDRTLRTHGSVDHIVPWSKGGNDSPENLRAAHAHCNRQRGDASHEEDPAHEARGVW